MSAHPNEPGTVPSLIPDEVRRNLTPEQALRIERAILGRLRRQQEASARRRLKPGSVVERWIKGERRKFVVNDDGFTLRPYSAEDAK